MAQQDAQQGEDYKSHYDNNLTMECAIENTKHTYIRRQ